MDQFLQKKFQKQLKNSWIFDLDKKKFQMEGPIRNLGVTQVQVKLHPKVTGSLKVWIKEA